jgi:serine/threonine protein kinase
MRIDSANKIGYGGYGNVYKATYNGKTYAVKQIKYDNEIGINANILHEIKMMNNIDHPNIIKCIDVDIDNKNNMINIYMNKYDTNLQIYIAYNNIMAFNINLIFLTILDTLKYLHNKGYYHGDLSSKNIFINDHNDFVIGDLAFMRKSYRNIIKIPTKEICPYEIFMKDEYIDGEKIDIWSLGCLYYFMLTKDIIITGNNALECIKDINDFHNTKSRTNFIQIDQIYCDIINKMICKNIYKRPTISELNRDQDIILLKLSSQRKPIIQHNENKIPSLCYSHQSEHDYILMIDFYYNICRNFNVSCETVHVCLHITEKLKVDIIDVELYAIIFNISCKIVDDIDIPIKYINKYMNKYNINYTAHEMSNRILNICTKINWDIDPDTVYKYRKYMLKDDFTRLNMLLIILNIKNSFNEYSQLTKIISMYIIMIYVKHNNIINNGFIMICKKLIHDQEIFIEDIAHCILNINNNFLSCYKNKNNEIFKYVEYIKLTYNIDLTDIFKCSTKHYVIDTLSKTF